MIDGRSSSRSPPNQPSLLFVFLSSPTMRFLAFPLREKVTVGFHNTAAAMPAPFMAIVEPRLMMRVPLETTWPRAFVALAGCVESYVAGRGFVPDLLRYGMHVCGLLACALRASVRVGGRGWWSWSRNETAGAGKEERGCSADFSGCLYTYQMPAFLTPCCSEPPLRSLIHNNVAPSLCLCHTRSLSLSLSCA